jgi:cytochrome c-type biogenesis protein CcmE
MKSKWLIGALFIGGALLAISVITMKQYSVYFYTPKEAKDQAMTLSEKEIKVGGMVQSGSLKWDSASLSLSFVLTDLQGTDIQVRYYGSPPDLLKESAGVVAQGRILQTGTLIQATKLMVKHSEEYKVPKDQHAINPELLKKSLFME